MNTRIMILPYGDVLLGKKQKIGFDDTLKWHIYWISDGDKYVSVWNKKSKRVLLNIAKKWNWTILERYDNKE
jgi:hypothetical protein